RWRDGALPRGKNDKAMTIAAVGAECASVALFRVHNKKALQMSNVISQWLHRGVFAAPAILSLATMTPASAAVVGSFDPAFGPDIPNLGFRGTITLDVSSGCFAAGVGGGPVGNNGTT